MNGMNHRGDKKHREKTSNWLLCALCVFGGVFFASTIRADEPKPTRFEVPIGMTAQGTPIVALINKEDQDLKTKKIRVLLIGGQDGGAKGPEVIRRYIRWFDTDIAAAELRKKYLVSAIPNAGILSADADMPPKDGYYNAAKHREGAYLWRWLGVFAPDLIFDDYWLTESDDRFAVAAREQKIGGVDSIHTITRSFGAGVEAEDSRFLPLELLAEFEETSPARKELLRRQERSAREITTELLQVYGKEVKPADVAYIPALAVIGRMRCAAFTKSAEVREQSAKMLEQFLPPEIKLTPKSGSNQAGHLLFAEAVEGASPEKKKRLTELVSAAADQIFDENGTARPLMPFHNEMSDAVFMAGPILAAAGNLTREQKYYDACYQHLVGMRKLCLREDGLYRHSPLDEAAWGRGNGFPALGLSWVLRYWPKDDPRRKEILSWQREHLTALLAHQDYSGCWHQVIDKPASYREFSCTAMIGYAMLEGILAGELDCAKFEPAAQRSWKAIKIRIGPNGKLVDVCTGTGKQKSLQDYYDRPAILGVDNRGGAMALLFATSMLRLEEPE